MDIAIISISMHRVRSLATTLWLPSLRLAVHRRQLVTMHSVFVHLNSLQELSMNGRFGLGLDLVNQYNKKRKRH
jgi:hypothetical protein